MSRYSMLVRVLDQIRNEAAGTKWAKIYAISESPQEKIEQARSRAMLHLYLKVMFGILDFSTRESQVTDGSGDGGIDAYHIDTASRIIYLIQSKFRTSEKNFEAKSITPAELLVMDVTRVLEGEHAGESGEKYNGKIAGLQRRMGDISDIARYKQQVVILANVKGLDEAGLKRLTGGYSAEVFDFKRSYTELVYPVIGGTFFQAEELTIGLDLDNKTAGGRTSYSVQTSEYDCEITVLFVPLIEIASTMNKYRNAVLEFNPRSYLELEGRKINSEIRESATRVESNEFALLNNGLTVLSDETSFSEKVGVKGKARLSLKNLQIINGGQTAFTLSRILDDDPKAASKLKGKEALMRVITVTPRYGVKATEEAKATLIEQISSATNRQTPVSGADRASNGIINKEIQKALFEICGLLVERKRGEFSEGIRLGYIYKTDVIERNTAMRLIYTALGQVSRAMVKKVFIGHTINADDLAEINVSEKLPVLKDLFFALAPRETGNFRNFRTIVPLAYFGVERYGVPAVEDRSQWLQVVVSRLQSDWDSLVKLAQNEHTKKSGEKAGSAKPFRIGEWQRSDEFYRDIERFNTQNRVLYSSEIEL